MGAFSIWTTLSYFFGWSFGDTGVGLDLCGSLPIWDADYDSVICFTQAMISAEQQGCSLGFHYTLCLYLPRSLFGVGGMCQIRRVWSPGPALSLSQQVKPFWWLKELAFMTGWLEEGKPLLVSQQSGVIHREIDQLQKDKHWTFGTTQALSKAERGFLE